jgi:hypothetical protein
MKLKTKAREIIPTENSFSEETKNFLALESVV